MKHNIEKRIKLYNGNDVKKYLNNTCISRFKVSIMDNIHYTIWPLQLLKGTL